MKREGKVSNSTFASLPGGVTLTVIFGNVWPVFFGAGVGETVANAGAWAHPGLTAVMSGAIVQLLIALLRSLFTERRDVMASMREMIKVRDEQEELRRAEDTRIRHELANQAHEAVWKVAILTPPPARLEDIPEIQPLYDIPAEEAAEAKRRKLIKEGHDAGIQA
jgi:Zn-dependent protease with chaperone function